MTDRAKFSALLSDPSLLLTIPATGIYYAIVFQPALRGGLLYRYTTQHVIEYVIVTLFIWAVIDVLLKVRTFPRELWALRQNWLPPRSGRVPVAAAGEMLADVQSHSPRMVESRVGQRLVHALSFLVENKSAEEFPEQLRYLSDQDQERTYNRYTLIGFVVAVTPILGFLGTVVHFGHALSGMTIEHMHEELSNVVSTLGTAFNTTTVALAASMVSMFAKFMCERADKGIDARIDRLVERELLNRFEVKAANLGPLATLLEQANAEFHESVEKSLQQQLTAWSQALEMLYGKFDQRQKHEEQRWQAMCIQLQERQQKQETSSDQQMQRILSIADQRQEQHLGQIQRALEQASSFSGEVGTLAKTLQGIARGEGRLADLQRTLTENLKVLHETNQIDAALHGLTAAIHLLTVRHPDGAHGKAA